MVKTLPGCIISLGSINVDVAARGDHWPSFGKSERAERFHIGGGGRAANVALFTARLGVETRLIVHVGDDLLRELALRSLREAGVDLRSVAILPGLPTSVTEILVRDDGAKAMLVADEATSTWSPEDIDAAARTIDASPSGSILVVDLDIPTRVVESGVGVARDRGFPVVLDPSHPERLPDTLLRRADYVTPDAGEAERLTGIAVTSVEDATRAGQVLVERGVQAALVKLEHGGCVVVTRDLRAAISTRPVQVVDSTGAGDAFAAGLAVALHGGQAILDAARFAVASANFAVTAFGAQGGNPTRDVLLQTLDSTVMAPRSLG